MFSPVKDRRQFQSRRYARFLNHAYDLIFLRKVGSGYIFMQRLLLVHFAAMNDAREA